ncbi:MAG TPA: ATP synthase F1 subunit gamma [Verrucomicrobiota bacterium]|nr:ATP synthase F1 subunit gamma [Verrucomicrobiota bacterium]HNU49847.1 ATP synthase F1 subunit gamma [Verrucomicrobiota bacterium]
MPSTRDIRRRIRSVKNTAQITKAMQMVASSKMRKAQETAIAGRPYARLMSIVLREVLDHAGDFSHPLMERREVRRRAVVVISTDKGLCGALNANLAREAARYDASRTDFLAAGRRVAQFLVRTRRTLSFEFSYSDTPKFAEARAISRAVRQLFTEGKVDAVDIVFSRFISTLSQEPTVLSFLPVTDFKLQTPAAQIPRGEGPEADQEAARRATEFLFEPGPEQVLGNLLPRWLNFMMYQLLLEAKASEHSARMVAMKNATDNANQLVKDLTLEYNKIRQAAITKELLEISSAAMAVA